MAIISLHDMSYAYVFSLFKVGCFICPLKTKNLSLKLSSCLVSFPDIAQSETSELAYPQEAQCCFYSMSPIHFWPVYRDFFMRKR